MTPRRGQTELMTTALTVSQELEDEDLRAKIVKRFVHTGSLGEALVYVLTSECNWGFEEALALVREKKKEVTRYERILRALVAKHKARVRETGGD